MTFIAYGPEPPMYNDPILSFMAFQEAGKRVGCTIEADPLGPVNRIVSLVVGSDQRRVKASLVGWHELVGAEVKVERVNSPTMTLWTANWEPTWRSPSRRGYRVTIDGREVLYATDAEIWPAPIPTPEPALKSGSASNLGGKACHLPTSPHRHQRVRPPVRVRARGRGRCAVSGDEAVSALSTALTDEMMTAWRAGMCDGLEMAAKMARALIDHPDMSYEQRAAVSGLHSALQQSSLELAAEGRTR